MYGVLSQNDIEQSQKLITLTMQSNLQLESFDIYCLVSLLKSTSC